jgi:hypothetical protein
MKIPKWIKVGQQRLKIVVRDVVKARNGEEILGMTLTSVSVIEIGRTYHGKVCPEDSLADTIFHEIIHSVNSIYGIGLTERQVIGLSGGLLAVIRDNKLDFSDRGK